MPHELKFTLLSLKFWRIFSTWRRGIEARGLSQRDNAEILSCYELLSRKQSSKCSVAMLTYGEFCCNQRCCEAGGDHGVTFGARGSGHVTERSANFEFINPCWKPVTSVLKDQPSCKIAIATTYSVLSPSWLRTLWIAKCEKMLQIPAWIFW